VLLRSTGRSKGCFYIVLEGQRGAFCWLNFPVTSSPGARDPAPVMSPSEYCHAVRCRKKNGVAIPTVKSVMICSAVSTQYRRVTDRQTDSVRT